MHELAERTAILTGASRGIGPHIAEALAAEHANLVLAGRSVRNLERTLGTIQCMGGQAIAVKTDLGEDAHLTALVRAAHESFGTVDILVNNAASTTISSYDNLEPAAIARIIRVNLTAPMLLTRLVLPTMLSQQRGHIVS
jgi:short-subunit dehydrogenase